MEQYEALLDKALAAMPRSVLEKERFEIPKALGHIQGNRTIISNFLQIANTLHREPEHLLKFILKELATPGEMKKSGAVILGAKVSASKINDRIRKYAQEFVLCIECGKPDTKIAVERNISFLSCQACGAKHPVKI